MPESKVCPSAKKKAQAKQHDKEREAEARKKAAPVDRSWVPWVFVPLGLFGVLWLVVYYIGGAYIPFMKAMGNWNMLVGIGCMAASFVVATFWK